MNKKITEEAILRVGKLSDPTRESPTTRKEVERLTKEIKKRRIKANKYRNWIINNSSLGYVVKYEYVRTVVNESPQERVQNNLFWSDHTTFM